MKMCELSVSVLCKAAAHLTSYCELLCITQPDNLARNFVFLEFDRPLYDASPGSKMWRLLAVKAQHLVTFMDFNFRLASQPQTFYMVCVDAFSGDVLLRMV